MNNKNNLESNKGNANFNKLRNPQNQRKILKSKIMDKFEVSSEEANKILLKIEKKTIDDIPDDLQQHNKDRNYLKKENNVDVILENIVPNYNQQISIMVDHVDLTFEVQNEKIDTLKETFIRTLKRNKTKKIKIHALNDVSFKIYKGEKVGIIGYNGAGKSTLLNVISGIYQPDKGNVATYGNISPLLSLGAGFDYNFSGRKNIILNGAVLGYDKEFLESKIEEIIEFSELGDYIDIPIKNYSSGMLAKLGFSIATSVNPDILIIDEILGVGDVNFQKKSADKIKSLMDGGTTVLLVSHSIPQIRALCDKAIWMDNGMLREIGNIKKTVADLMMKQKKLDFDTGSIKSSGMGDTDLTLMGSNIASSIFGDINGAAVPVDPQPSQPAMNIAMPNVQSANIFATPPTSQPQQSQYQQPQTQEPMFSSFDPDTWGADTVQDTSYAVAEATPHSIYLEKNRETGDMRFVAVRDDTGEYLENCSDLPTSDPSRLKINEKDGTVKGEFDEVYKIKYV